MVEVVKRLSIKKGTPGDENYKDTECALGLMPQSVLSSSCD